MPPVPAPPTAAGCRSWTSFDSAVRSSPSVTSDPAPLIMNPDRRPGTPIHTLFCGKLCATESRPQCRSTLRRRARGRRLSTLHRCGNADRIRDGGARRARRALRRPLPFLGDTRASQCAEIVSSVGRSRRMASGVANVCERGYRRLRSELRLAYFSLASATFRSIRGQRRV